MTAPPPDPPRPWPKLPLWSVIALSMGIAALLVLGLVLIVGGEDDADVTDAGRESVAAPAAEPSDYPYPSDDPTPGTTTQPRQENYAGSGPDKIMKLAEHPMLADANAGLPNLACQLPPWRSGPAAAKEYFRAATGCLNAAWEPFLRQHNLPFTPPDLRFPTDDEFESDCGTITVGVGTAAYYCEGELFLPYHGLQTDQYGDNPGVYLALIAHEYGHHVQELSGIMDAAWEKIYAAGEHSRAGEEMSRRKELQAQCFSGMFLGSHVERGGSITREMYNQAWEDQETRGDDTSGGHNHGSNENYAAWWRIGAIDNRIVDCNTFTASRAEVR
ncbi:MAG: neutral zinc metallopeptidase [Haloechinothrix sp.]